MDGGLVSQDQLGLEQINICVFLVKTRQTLDQPTNNELVSSFINGKGVPPHKYCDGNNIKICSLSIYYKKSKKYIHHQALIGETRQKIKATNPYLGEVLHEYINRSKSANARLVIKYLPHIYEVTLVATKKGIKIYPRTGLNDFLLYTAATGNYVAAKQKPKKGKISQVD